MVCISPFCAAACSGVKPPSWGALGRRHAQAVVSQWQVCPPDAAEWSGVTFIFIADGFSQHALAAAPIELAVEDLLPRTKSSWPPVMATITFAPSTWRLSVRIGVVFARIVMTVVG